MFSLALAAAAFIALAAPVPAACGAAEGTPSIALRFLLLSQDGSEPSLEAWKNALEAEGVPFDVFVVEDEPALTPNDLLAGPGRGRYQAVVMAAGDVGLAPSEEAALDAYERSFGIREVVAFADAGSPGVSFPTEIANLDGDQAEVTDAGALVFPYLAGPITIERSFGYRVEPAAGADLTPLLVDQTGAPLVLVLDEPDGREVLLVTVGTEAAYIHFWALVPGMIDWASQGVHLGFWRNYLSVQVDDVLLPNFRWDSRWNRTDHEAARVIRMTPEDLDRAAEWQRQQDFKLDLGLNGYGIGQPCEALTTKVIARGDEFRWFNHTYAHPNLDTLSTAEIADQISQNVDWAGDNGIAFDSKELVTGEHSGLENPELLPALDETGITWVASDASRRPDTEQLGTAHTVPRHPNNLYDNTGTKAEQLDEYNYLYYETCEDGCLDHPADWQEFVDQESQRILYFAVSNNPRPEFIHQDNLAEEGTFYPLFDAVLDRYRGLMNVPLVQPTLTEAGTQMVRLQAWWQAVQGGAVDAYRMGDDVVIECDRDLWVPITGTTAGAHYGGELSGWIEAKAGQPLQLEVTAS